MYTTLAHSTLAKRFFTGTVHILFILCCLCVWMLTRVAQIITATHRDLQYILYTQTYLWTVIAHQKLGQTERLYGSKLTTKKKMGINRHFQASWTSQPMGCLFIRHDLLEASLVLTPWCYRYMNTKYHSEYNVIAHWRYSGARPANSCQWWRRIWRYMLVRDKHKNKIHSKNRVGPSISTNCCNNYNAQVWCAVNGTFRKCVDKKTDERITGTHIPTVIMQHNNSTYTGPSL